MRQLPLRQKTSKRWLIPVQPGKPEHGRQRGNDGWRATAELRRVQARSHRRSQETRAAQTVSSQGRAKKVLALILFTVLAAAGIASRLLPPGEILGLYVGLAAIGWLPVPKGPWSDVAPAASSRLRVPKRRASKGARSYSPSQDEGAKRRRVRRAGRARRRARRPAGRV
jgi:hypothetical protein